MFLIGLGLTDLARSEIRRASRARLVVAIALGVVAMGAIAALGGLTRAGDLVLLVLGATVLGGWAVLSDRAMHSGRATPPLAALAIGISGLLVLSGLSSRAGGALHTWQLWTALPRVTHLSTPPAAGRRCLRRPVQHSQFRGPAGPGQRRRHQAPRAATGV